ncbi:hypothetical protein GCM10011581_02870 [Saccharopolyspora subtropica]|uniref:Uncharacterized protein n=1 Tax=Saccharopolyspora thermophila TaxID=89367 RepID=A0A917JHT4_9PSEU|nr:hypothetical protein [Saccharopolyspora subtropica]GGI69295.1 hypothetical protein GCM10011581_02870 [Saccharopolyspora subtropica]
MPDKKIERLGLEDDANAKERFRRHLEKELGREIEPDTPEWAWRINNKPITAWFPAGTDNGDGDNANSLWLNDLNIDSPQAIAESENQANSHDYDEADLENAAEQLDGYVEDVRKTDDALGVEGTRAPESGGSSTDDGAGNVAPIEDYGSYSMEQCIQALNGIPRTMSVAADQFGKLIDRLAKARDDLRAQVRKLPNSMQGATGTSSTTFAQTQLDRLDQTVTTLRSGGYENELRDAADVAATRKQAIVPLVKAYTQTAAAEAAIDKLDAAGFGGHVGVIKDAVRKIRMDMLNRARSLVADVAEAYEKAGSAMTPAPTGVYDNIGSGDGPVARPTTASPGMGPTSQTGSSTDAGTGAGPGVGAGANIGAGARGGVGAGTGTGSTGTGAGVDSVAGTGGGVGGAGTPDNSVVTDAMNDAIHAAGRAGRQALGALDSEESGSPGTEAASAGSGGGMGGGTDNGAASGSGAAMSPADGAGPTSGAIPTIGGAGAGSGGTGSAGSQPTKNTGKDDAAARQAIQDALINAQQQAAQAGQEALEALNGDGEAGSVGAVPVPTMSPGMEQAPEAVQDAVQNTGQTAQAAVGGQRNIDAAHAGKIIEDIVQQGREAAQQSLDHLGAGSDEAAQMLDNVFDQAAQAGKQALAAANADSDITMDEANQIVDDVLERAKSAGDAALSSLGSGLSDFLAPSVGGATSGGTDIDGGAGAGQSLDVTPVSNTQPHIPAGSTAAAATPMGAGGLPMMPPMMGGGLGGAGASGDTGDRERTTWLADDGSSWSETTAAEAAPNVLGKEQEGEHVAQLVHAAEQQVGRVARA